MGSILSIGDCNTLGAGEMEYRSYPERFGARIGKKVLNRGVTMSTTREGIRLLSDNLDSSVDLLSIQFGLVDSWRTFRYAPYVLYYPDNIFRKAARKVVKKYKKLCRNAGCNRALGEKFLVSAEEYEANLLRMIEIARSTRGDDISILLVDTAPNKDTKRNGYIMEYNSIMTDIAGRYGGVHKVDIYQYLLDNMNKYYLDNTHLNEAGCDLVAAELERVYRTLCDQEDTDLLA